MTMNKAVREHLQVLERGRDRIKTEIDFRAISGMRYDFKDLHTQTLMRDEEWYTKKINEILAPFEK